MNPYECPECEGDLEVECCECGNLCECLNCQGTGLDPEQIDIARWKKAVEEIEQPMPFAMSQGVYRDGKHIGQQWDRNGATLLFADFLLEGGNDAPVMVNSPSSKASPDIPTAWHTSY